MTAPETTAHLGGRSAIRLLATIDDAGSSCGQVDPDLFVGPDGFESPRQLKLRENAAKSVCRGCPAIVACLAYALEIRPMHGVWAGLNASELRALDRPVVA
ncbi:WhiB family transcriptional regulator [Nonomuraea soli]|uniref:Transcriptional regulator WhiB n=1 Tax=Nonomuraea soli TaxID=1032476 RepID=A0A7W0CST7_9ACTN|nr:WhiB family transcriptional regulator [Nonomuraea soli]MBA2896640.1 WhiB family redox-sensing transcriptional regulator [Nonomuraea soli]